MLLSTTDRKTTANAYTAYAGVLSRNELMSGEAKHLGTVKFQCMS